MYFPCTHTCTAAGRNSPQGGVAGRDELQKGVAGREDVAPLSLKVQSALSLIEHSSAHTQPSSRTHTTFLHAILSLLHPMPLKQHSTHKNRIHSLLFLSSLPLLAFGQLYRIHASTAASSSSWGKIDQLVREARRAHTRRLLFGCRLDMPGSRGRGGEGKCRRATPYCRTLTTSTAMAFDVISSSSSSPAVHSCKNTRGLGRLSEDERASSRRLRRG